MIIRELRSDEIENAIELIWTVFEEFEFQDYSEQGVKEFYRSIHDSKFLSMLKFYGAFREDDIIGTIATRNNGNHIALFFVIGQYHHQGIGKSLFMRIREDNNSGKITVNSSPFAVPIYRHLGFKDVEQEKVTNGLRYTPMECKV